MVYLPKQVDSEAAKIKITTKQNNYDIYLYDFRISTTSKALKSSLTDRVKKYHKLMYAQYGAVYLHDLFCFTEDVKAMQTRLLKAKDEYEKTLAKVEKKKRDFLEELNPNLFSVRFLTGADLSKALDLDYESDYDVWKELKNCPKNAINPTVVGVFSDGDLIGYCCVNSADEYNHYPDWNRTDTLLHSIYVKPEFRNTNAINQMINFAINEEGSSYATFKMYVKVPHADFVPFYEQFGFKPKYEPDNTWNGVLSVVCTKRGLNYNKTGYTPEEETDYMNQLPFSM